MKNIFKKIAIASAVITGFMTTACEDMMTVNTGDKAYVNAQDTLYSYLGIMRAMQDVAERQVILGEIRGDLVMPTSYTTDTLYAISNFDNPQDLSCSMLQVSDYYNVINNCNFYIHNADTSAVKNDSTYMKPEYAQVKAVRAWAYLQLVKNYKEVPFITKPVNNLGVIENFDYENNLVNKDNLVNKIIEDGLEALVDMGYPSYGSFSSGATGINIDARLLFIPIRVILGDMYLLRGSSVSDYEKAARLYYEYLEKENTPLGAQYCTPVVRRGEVDDYTSSGWGNWAASYNVTANNDVISLIPSSANAGFGKMLTRVANIFGYTTSSSQYLDDSSASDDSEDGTEAAGSISVIRNYKRQYCPSYAYDDVVNQQTYVGIGADKTTKTYIQNCDARYGLSVESQFTYESESYPLCSKAARGGSFYYTIPIYRKTLIWLRLAEAINRAGYPEFAFAILKDGLNKYNFPSIVEKQEIKNGAPILDEDGEIIGYEQDTTSYKVFDYGDGAMYYLSIEDSTRLQKFNSWLSFNNDKWNATYGIHARGAGFGDGTLNGNGTRTTNIFGYNDTIYYDYTKLLLAQNLDTLTATLNDTINAVENIIVDELALETAFEGNRFTDLVRIAEHKTASGFDGVDWLAKKIASRNYKTETTTSPAQGTIDQNLYSKLQNTNLWYFELPKWRTK